MCVCLNIKQMDNTLLSINNTSENTNFKNIFLKVIPSLWSWVCLPCKWNIHCTCIHQIFVHKVDTQVGGTMVKMYFINARNFNCRDRKSNKEMPERTGIADLNVEIKKRRWKYLDHLLRRDTEIFEMDSTR